MFARALPAPFSESCGAKGSDAREVAAVAAHVSIGLCEVASRRGETGGSHAGHPTVLAMLVPPEHGGWRLLAGGESSSVPPARPHGLHAELGGVGAVGREAVVPPAPCSSLGFPGSGPSRAVPGIAT